MVEQVLVLNGADDHVYDYEEGVEQIGKCVDQDDRLRHTYLQMWSVRARSRVNARVAGNIGSLHTQHIHVA